MSGWPASVSGIASSTRSKEGGATSGPLPWPKLRGHGAARWLWLRTLSKEALDRVSHPPKAGRNSSGYGRGAGQHRRRKIQVRPRDHSGAVIDGQLRIGGRDGCGRPQRFRRRPRSAAIGTTGGTHTPMPHAAAGEHTQARIAGTRERRMLVGTWPMCTNRPLPLAAQVRAHQPGTSAPALRMESITSATRTPSNLPKDPVLRLLCRACPTSSRG